VAALDPWAPPPGPATPDGGDSSAAPAVGASGGNGSGASGAGADSTWRPAAGGPPVPPSLTLPKGGGAIRDIGEKFDVNAATGTASLTVPVPTSKGRGDFGPSLSLTYDSGAGNGPFGLGWKISLPAITRKTDKGLPRYADDPDADTFILSGSEDLVPVRTERDGRWQQAGERRTAGGRDYAVQRYRPRTEGLFARIERWRDLRSSETHWRTISSANLTTVYGATAASRIADPADPARVFSWLISGSYDDNGNVALYDYLAEDGAGVGAGLASERNRTPRTRSAARYLKRISYGNRTPHFPGPDNQHPKLGRAHDHLFEVVFDYGDHEGSSPGPEPDQPWPCRPDPFSSYRPGFELRTYRRCHRVLMFHHFPAESDVGADCLVSSTDLTYASTGRSGMTTVGSIVHTGYRRLGDGSYRRQSLPPLEFRYRQAVIGDQVSYAGPQTLANLPAGIDPQAYQWADLDGEGLSGILTRQQDAWFYKANLGGGRFAPQRMLATQPAMAPAGRRQELLDLAGDGHLDLVELGGPVPGFYERTSERGWREFRPFRSHPGIAWDDPDLRMVDLDGDGLSDVLITRDDAFAWHPSLGRDGFGAAHRTYQPQAEERGPRLVFADPEQTIYLADFSGDGLSDLVRVRNGEVCYWPNIGYGRFGAKVTMDHSPWLDEPGRFDQRRVRLADVDGAGTADLIYLHARGARLYLNQSGNGFAAAHALAQEFPLADDLAQVNVTDLLGRGTACLVWSSPLPGAAGRQLRYLDLMPGGKPYLLTELANNLGAETRVSYAPSTQFYLADAAAGRPWLTRLPFPVQVVERVEVTDLINRNRCTTRRAYHHGYYDGFEREFRGFGLVEQWDTEDLAILEAGARDEFVNLSRETDLPPVLTRTWMHTGACPAGQAAGDPVGELFADEYYRPPGGGDPGLPATALPGRLRVAGRPARPWCLSPVEAREASRALKGAVLRTEMFALDGTAAQHRPYVVTQHNYTIELLQPGAAPRPDGPQNYHGVFLTHVRETVTAHYERALYPAAHGQARADPRILHELVLEVDDFGNPLLVASAGYGRRDADPELPPCDRRPQRELRLTSTKHQYTNLVDRPDAHRTPMPSRTLTFEIVGLRPRQHGLFGQASQSALFGFGELRDGLARIQAELPVPDWDTSDRAADAGPASRLISATRVRYLRDDLAGPLPDGVLESRALPYLSYRQVLTGGLVTSLYGDAFDAAALTAAGYIRDGDAWWLPSGQAFYSPDPDDDAAAELAFGRAHFFLPCRFRNPFGATTIVSYDRYDLLVAQTRDPLGNLITVGERDDDEVLTAGGNDYRVLQPRLVSDPNRNRSAVAFDAMGRVCGTAMMGKPGQGLGDSLDGFEPDPEPAVVAGYFAAPFDGAHRLLGEATTRIIYDLDGYLRTRRDPAPRAAGVAVLARETHVSELAPGASSRIQRVFSYSDGSGREVQRKGQAAAGPVADGGPGIEHRWIGSGWTIFNNKGKPVATFEPFFSATQQFEFARTQGVADVLFYDPPGRVIATLHPDGSFAKTVFDPWHQDTWDAGDTVLLDPREDADVAGYAGRYLAGLAERPGGWASWYQQRIGGALGRAQRRAAAQSSLYAGTPSRAWTDALGRIFRTVAHNRAERDAEPVDQYLPAVRVLDIQGNAREVRDALGRAAVRYGYTMLSAQVTSAGLDAGGGALLPDVTGQSAYYRTSRGFEFRTEYDALRRPVGTHVSGPGITGRALVARTEYGESEPGAQEANLRTRIFRQFDGAGVSTHHGYDFKGNLLASGRQLAAHYRDVLDWAGDVPLEDREYSTETSYDALNRAVSITAPDGSVVLPAYDPASLLDRIEARLRGAEAVTTFVARLDYNARGQRTLICYGNGSSSAHSYDPLTFRLTGLTTRRGSRRLQDLRYTYDPVGNPTQVRDRAQQRVFFRNKVADPAARYRYDALYRLTEATGREHLGQAAGGGPGPDRPGARDAARTGRPQPGDGAAMARYTERYRYDEVGNLLRLAHHSADPALGGWTRDYHYREPSLLEAGRVGNRLTGTGAAPPPSDAAQFRYDEQGNTTAMPQLPVLRWDQDDRLHESARQDGDRPRTTYYVYDASGQRVRKVTERAARDGAAKRGAERIYIGAFEVHRRYDAGGNVTLERETLGILDENRRVALVETRTAGTDGGTARVVRYQLGDHLDSSVLELDQRGAVLSYEEYYPYGSTSYQAVRARTGAPKRYRYTGKERDRETGLCYYGARYYAPWLGRWLTCDPLGVAPSPRRRAGRTGAGGQDGAAPNLYQYVAARPTTLIDPDGRQERRPRAAAPSGDTAGAGARGGAAGGAGAGAARGAAAGGSAAAGGAGPGGAGSGGAARPASGGGIFGAIGRALHSVSSWMRDWLPGLIAAPLAGLVDVLAGFTRAIGGIFSWKGHEVTEGLKDMGLGALSMIGLKEAVADRWISPREVGVLTTGQKMPRTLAQDIADASREQQRIAPNAALNGMHAWHAATNAHIINRLGPVMAPFLWIAGLIHESPIDWGSFQSEQRSQGTVNHILDSSTDIVANTWGILLGLLLPRKIAVQAGAFTGNYIPGPGDPDPTGAGTGGYTGNPTDAWGQYP
jgi:RHS repeat-associated protein